MGNPVALIAVSVCVQWCLLVGTGQSRDELWKGTRTVKQAYIGNANLQHMLNSAYLSWLFPPAVCSPPPGLAAAPPPAFLLFPTCPHPETYNQTPPAVQPDAPWLQI